VPGGARDGAVAGIVDPEDRRYVESLAAGTERATVIASLTRYRKPEALLPGDPLPAVRVRRADDLAPVDLTELVCGRPLLLAFGSFT